MKRIDDDIKSGQYKNLYLLYGTEAYLKLQYKNKLIKALVNDGDTMNFSKYTGTGLNIAGIIDEAETMPFLAEHRIILMEDTGFGKKMPEDMGDYLSNIPESTIFIFVEESADKRGKLYKAAKECGRDIEMKMPDEHVLATWVGAKLKDEGVQIKRDAWSLFLMMCHESMDNMDHELEKLISYVGDRKQITAEDVREVCVAQVETKIFDMINAISAKDLNHTMDLYNDMLFAKEPPMYILTMIVRQFRQMKIVKECANYGDNPGNIARKVGMPDFAVKRTMQLAKNFSNKEIQDLLEDAADLEEKTKNGLLDDNLAVELIIMKYAGNISQ
ncbi:MAG: DNA polymerase III subunit delta [Pseudobutyrivibrio sp.]|nr:DNA polymerase III subunit delta [Pseudobutyrivibrio sp.]